MTSEADSISYEFDAFRIDAGKRLLLDAGGEPISLTPKVFDTLLYLVRNSGKVIEKDELMSAIWTDTIVEENNLNKNISVLRHVLGEMRGEHRFIVTVPGKGYKFVAPVSKVMPGSLAGDGRNGVAPMLSDPPARAHQLSRNNRPKGGNERTSRFWFAVLAIATSAGLGLVGFYSWREVPTDTPINSVAVLPFVNVGGDAEMEYLSDGLSEGLIDRLSELPQLKVIARNSSFKYRNENEDLQTVAQKLGVQAIVTGKVTRRGDDLIIRVELIDARDNKQLWGGQFIRKATDALGMEREITRTVTSKIGLKLSGAQEQRLTKHYTENPEAYQAYLRGRFLRDKVTPQDLNRSIEFYKQAIALDPNFALAYVGLAESTGRLTGFIDIPDLDYEQKAREYILKAMSLDEMLPEAHATLGPILSSADHDFAGAEREYQRALELNPNYAEAHLWRGKLLSVLGKHEEALAEIRRGMELDPISLGANSAYSGALFLARRYDESIAESKKALELDKDYFPAHFNLAVAYAAKGDYAGSIAERVKMNELGGTRQRAAAIQKSFDKGGWEGFLRDTTSDNPPFDVPPFILVTFCAELGKKDKAFAILEKLFEKRSPDLVVIKVDPRLDNLRGDPRFQELVLRVGLPQ